MLAKRIIPCLDIDQGRVVKGVNFVNLVDAGDPLENAMYYDGEGADEIIFLDITASSDRRDIIYDMARNVADNIYTPFTIGGGLRTVEDMIRMVKAGADKVSLNSAAVKNPEIVRDGARVFGSQCIVVSIDAKSNNKGSFDVYVKGGRENTGLDALEWAKRVEELGAGEIMLTSMDRDGTRQGYDLELTQRVSDAVSIPVIASGGVGEKRHLLEGFTKGKASAVLAASIFHFREISIQEVRDYLRENKIPVKS
ncbi:MAG TPA: imidazole glycerol phosphate synthase subunit HisF [Spirochaetes bacterium]|nr:imidazole glycerol phosphate synthase subunit HisF [Spirochaetota bacterium]